MMQEHKILDKDQTMEIVGQVLEVLRGEIESLETRLAASIQSVTENQGQIKEDLDYIKDGYNDVQQTLSDIVAERD